MIKWGAVSRPKDFGGLGIINTGIMNECLLIKWIWKIYSDCDETWCKLVKAKYKTMIFLVLALGITVLARSTQSQTPTFWLDVWLGTTRPPKTAVP